MGRSTRQSRRRRVAPREPTLIRRRPVKSANRSFARQIKWPRQSARARGGLGGARIKAIGNYGEMFERHAGQRSPLNSITA
jgi:hypothetical protein